MHGPQLFSQTPAMPAVPAVAVEPSVEAIERTMIDEFVDLAELIEINQWLYNVAAAAMTLANRVEQLARRGVRIPDDVVALAAEVHAEIELAPDCAAEVRS